MRDLKSLSEFRPSLIGTLGVISATAVGAPIDTMGFAEVMALCAAGSLVGSTGSTVGLTIKIQESASATGTNWTDITNEGISAGSFKLTTMTFGGGIAGGDTTGTWLPYQAMRQSGWTRSKDPNRLRYLRCHATLSGTVGLGPRFVAGFLLSGAADTDYILSGGVTIPSGNVELSKLL